MLHTVKPEHNPHSKSEPMGTGRNNRPSYEAVACSSHMLMLEKTPTLFKLLLIIITYDSVPKNSVLVSAVDCRLIYFLHFTSCIGFYSPSIVVFNTFF